jgi:hypothetical protein
MINLFTDIVEINANNSRKREDLFHLKVRKLMNFLETFEKIVIFLGIQQIVINHHFKKYFKQ